ncbi:MAG TPA: CRISPR-associated endonuclease Cas2 [Firmicutes bacterium]|jgi:CRISPR-associated protein Cas2|nr:CRISPR-associated endonuclease Cas2 [Eubacteriales bacterium]HBI56509.1 CRISPR-associated endonuclease Cas2 [Bacillota bacterium]
MRNRYIVCYDISDAKRLAKVYKKMRGFGDPVQYSVFKCDLSPQEKVMLIIAINELINNKEDRIMIIKVGPLTSDINDVFEFLGKAAVFTAPEAKII